MDLIYPKYSPQRYLRNHGDLSRHMQQTLTMVSLEDTMKIESLSFLI